MDWSAPPSVVDPLLDAARRERDPLGDAAVAELLRSGALRRGGGDLVGALEETNGPASRALLEFSNTVPPWVDFERMRHGTHVGLATPVQSALALVLGSLMETYAAAKGAKVLIRGGMLTKHVMKRLHDTSTFVLEVAASRGPKPGTHAFRHVLRTRLVHAFVRHGMDKRGDYDAAAWGEPVNQEDSASTLLAFCHVYLRSLERLGYALSAEEEDSVHHLYRWVGRLMGVKDELLTTTRTQERFLYAHIARRQHHPDADSRELARSLVTTLAGRAPFFLPAPALSTLSRHLLGERLASGLGLSASLAWTPLPRALPLISRVQRRVERVPFTNAPLEQVGERVARLVYEKGFVAEE
ncbi:MAG: DUF2236 domain-containing protein [Myxococcaceae bacterium]|nr:DUF2236 domain-containing protein [Myxococcaceae bacterium]